MPITFSGSSAEDIRSAFALPKDIAYFNCAYLSPMLKTSIESGHTGIGVRSRSWQIEDKDFYTGVENARRLFAGIINTSADNVAIVPAASYGFATVCINTHLSGRRRKILVIENEHPSNILQWRAKAQTDGGELQFISLENLRSSSAALCEAIDDRTAIVSITACHWIDGTLFDLKAIAKTCREMGASLVIDGTQSIGVLDFDFDDVRPDYLIVSGYKWLLGPYSVSFLAVHPSRQDGQPLERSRYNCGKPGAGHEWLDGRLQYPEEWQSGARRFDVGEKANFCLMPMVNTGLEWVRLWGTKFISKRISQIAERLICISGEYGLTPVSPGNHAPHLFGLRTVNRQPLSAALFQRHHVFVTCHNDIVRISPHIYNTEEDIRLFETALQQEAGGCQEKC